MAELDVERKKKSSLPWILLALLLVAVVAYFIWNNSRVDDTDVAPAAYDTTMQTDTTVQMVDTTRLGQ